MAQEGYIWPPPPPPNGQLDLRELFPRGIGKLTAVNAYRPEHVGMERISSKHYMRIVAGFRVKYREDDPTKVWFLFVWPLKRGQLFDKGKVGHAQGAERMEWLVANCPYEKFYKKRRFLVKLAEVIGRARPYPEE